MFRVQATKVAAATLTSSSCAPLHSSAVLHESVRKRQARLIRQKNLAKREELQKKAAAARPHVVLGTIASNDDEANAKWAACDLAKALVRPEELALDTPSAQRLSLPTGAATTQEGAEVRVPPSLGFGIGEREQRMLFEHLPMLSADMSTRREMTMPIWQRLGANPNAKPTKLEDLSAYHETELAAGVVQANALAKVVDLRNANAGGIAFENRRRVIQAFSEPGKPNDTGRTEVQAALLTLQIRNVWDHLRAFKRDVSNRRSLRRLVHQRAKLLKYLKRTDRDRYERILERLGLEPGAVEGELVV
jgi:small subunit ribosomal protein S15